ncbi:MAG: septum formation inhibitor Maf [Lysobacteraceae bacterium]|nr:MAG: septum formation inhibitor Maf [Xanthomonadaceae bacterium]
MLHLASQSPRRRELLARLGLDFGILEVDVPEHPAPGEPAEDYVRRVAREKAGAGLLRLIGQPAAVVLGADSEVVLGERIFGKPVDAEDAAAMLRALSGREHRVISAVSVVSAAREAQAVSVSQVTMAHLDEAMIARYLDSGEWRGKAGAYAIQGRAEAFIPRISGSYSGIMGLPLHETATLLRQFGLLSPMASSTRGQRTP